MKTIYFDNNATTQVADEVYEEMQPYFRRLYGNPSSMHTFGGQVGIKIREARERVAGLLGCDPSEIIFTSCGTESDNAAIHGTLAATAPETQGHHDPRGASGGPGRLPRPGEPRLHRCRAGRR